MISSDTVAASDPGSPRRYREMLSRIRRRRSAAIRTQPDGPPGTDDSAAATMTPALDTARPGIFEVIRRARKALPGDPYFGDRMSIDGAGGPAAAARAVHELIESRASRELSLAPLQLWQALNDAISGRQTQNEVTIVFTDLADFSSWTLSAGDDAAVHLLRRLAQTVEPAMIQAGGQVVKRMGEGIMASFPDPASATAAVLRAQRLLREVDVQGYIPAMRAGIHTGRPLSIGSDLVGVDVNIAARLMESAGTGGVLISGATLKHLAPKQLGEFGVVARKLRRAAFSARPRGVPADIAIYQLEEKGREEPNQVDELVAAG